MYHLMLSMSFYESTKQNSFKSLSLNIYLDFVVCVNLGSNMQESRDRANDMLQLLKKAKELSSKKCYNIEEVRNQAKTSKR